MNSEGEQTTTQLALRTTSDQPVVVGSVTSDSVTFAIAGPAADIVSSSVRTYSSTAAQTFTDAIGRYAQDQQLSLDGRQLILSVAGAVKGDSIRITNGRWFISLPGLRAVMRKQPVVLNDVSAVAWSTLALGPRDTHPLDDVNRRPGDGPDRRAVVWLGDGLGAACLAYDDTGCAFALDGEGGHMTCPVDTAEQNEWLVSARVKHGHLSYERAIAHLNAQSADHSIPAHRQSALHGVRSGVIGAFAGNVALAYGAWGGVYVAGPYVGTIGDAKARSIFRDRFVAKGRFRSALAAVPVWTIARDNLPLLGAVALLKSRNERADGW